jgi:hypothetical protein
MSRENKKFLLIGLWIIFLSIIGFPQDWKNYAFILTGAILIVLSVRGGTLRKAFKKVSQAGEEVFVDGGAIENKNGDSAMQASDPQDLSSTQKEISEIEEKDNGKDTPSSQSL